MAHLEKFTVGSAKGLSIHIERKTTNHSNKDIQTHKSKLNYDLCEKKGDMLSRLQERLKEVYTLKRDDVKAVADWIVTLPKEESLIEHQHEFFKHTKEFLDGLYGEENNIAAVVHMDETQPHMHYSFVPVAYDEKKDRFKVSAKEVLTRQHLQKFHNELDSYLKLKMPGIYEQGILNERTIGVDSVNEIKKLELLDQETRKMAQNGLKSLKGVYSDLSEVKTIQESVKKGLTGKYTLTEDQFKKLTSIPFKLVEKQESISDIVQEAKANKELAKNLKYETAHRNREELRIREHLQETRTELADVNRDKDRHSDLLSVAKNKAEFNETLLELSGAEDIRIRTLSPNALNSFSSSSRYITDFVKNGQSTKLPVILEFSKREFESDSTKAENLNKLCERLERYSNGLDQCVDYFKNDKNFDFSKAIVSALDLLKENTTEIHRVGIAKYHEQLKVEQEKEKQKQVYRIRHRL